MIKMKKKPLKVYSCLVPSITRGSTSMDLTYKRKKVKVLKKGLTGSR